MVTVNTLPRCPVLTIYGHIANGHQRAFMKAETELHNNRLWTIAVILLILWALGLTTAYTARGFIHILLVLAIVVVLIRVIQGRRAI